MVAAIYWTLTAHQTAAGHGLSVSSGSRGVQRKEGQCSCGCQGEEKGDLSPGGQTFLPAPLWPGTSQEPLSPHSVTQLFTTRQAPASPSHTTEEPNGDFFCLDQNGHLVWKPSVEPAQVLPGRAPGGRDACWGRACRVTTVPSSGPCSSSCRNSRLWSPTRSQDLTRWPPPRLGPASW